MGFQEALRTCFSKYAKADGRASRSEFWYFHLAIFVYMFVAGFGLGIVGASDAQMDLAILFLLIPIIVPSICVTARRLHDLNYSGWMQLIFYPGFLADELLGTGYVIYLVTLGVWAFWYSQPGKRGKNKFGAQPKK